MPMMPGEGTLPHMRRRFSVSLGRARALDEERSPGLVAQRSLLFKVSCLKSAEVGRKPFHVEMKFHRCTQVTLAPASFDSSSSPCSDVEAAAPGCLAMRPHVDDHRDG